MTSGASVTRFYTFSNASDFQIEIFIAIEPIFTPMK